MTGVRLLIEPVGPWFDIDDPAGLDEWQLEMLGSLRSLGIDLQAQGLLEAQRLGALGLLVPAVGDDAPPLLATLLAYRTLDRVHHDSAAQTDDAGFVQVPARRRVWTTDEELPLGGGAFRALHVRYAFPAPDGTLVVLTFASPCTPEQELLEWLFDEMVARVRFVSAQDEAPGDSPDGPLVLAGPPSHEGADQ